MNPILAMLLFWIIVATLSLLFGIACIKYGVYTSSSHGDKPTLEI